jgi:hypothetical protein
MGLGRGGSKHPTSDHPWSPSLGLNSVLQLLSDGGSDAFADSLRILVNEAMFLEGSAFRRLGDPPRPHQPQSLSNRLGPITFAIPLVRGDIDSHLRVENNGVRIWARCRFGPDEEEKSGAGEAAERGERLVKNPRGSWEEAYPR